MSDALHNDAAALALLYGADSAAGLCGCAQAPGGVRLWWRRGSALETEEVACEPYLVLSHRELLDAFKPEPRIEELKGGNYYRFKASFPDWAAHDEALGELNRTYRAHKADFVYEPVLALREPALQYLLASGRTFYQGLRLDQLSTLYLALRARNSGGADYADAAVEDDRIVTLGLSDGRGWSAILDGAAGEKALLAEALRLMLERDPDVLVGHDIFKGALSYFAARCKRHKLKLNLGRDGTPLKLRTSRAPAAEKQLEYPRADIAGRAVVDTWFLATYYDIVKRDLERFDAPYVARYLDRGCTLPDPLAPWEVERLERDDPAALAADVRCELSAAAAIFATLGGSYFAQAQMLPLSLQDCVVRGNATKINYLLLREYLRQGESVPAPVESHTFPGGHTEIRRSGLIRDVLNVDIASLYPSIMLGRGVQPGSDSLGVFQPLLAELTAQRLMAKREARSAADSAARVMADARQGAFKIFINSFFGYLGTGRMNWADPRQAEYITVSGQQLVKELARIVEAEGGSVIEIDTDGVYFTAPAGCTAAAEREALQARINAALSAAPGGAGISAEISAFYPAMLSYKVKNYALLGEDGQVTVKGSGMKSRGLEPFLHGFIEDALRAILEDQPQRIAARHADLRRAIEAHTIEIHALAKTDTLIEPLETYKAKVASGSGAGGRNRAAAYEIALQAARPLRPGDSVSYYITGEKHTVKAFEAAKALRAYDPQNPDYNVAYYVKKLDENLKKVQAYLEPGAPEGGGLFG